MEAVAIPVILYADSIDIPASFKFFSVDMGQKVTSENAAAVNLIKKDMHNEAILELLSCCQEGDRDRVKELLLANERLANCKGRKLRSPLHIAAENSHCDIISDLLEAGADIEAVDYVNRTPLMYACDKGKLEVVELLLSCGANYNTQDKYLLGPLHLAADIGAVEIVGALITVGADVDAKNRWQRTPLMHAAAAGSSMLVQMFILNGADVNAKDLVGKCALVKACASYHFDCALLLIQSGSELDLQSRHIAELMEAHDHDEEFAQLKVNIHRYRY